MKTSIGLWALFAILVLIPGLGTLTAIAFGLAAGTSYTSMRHTLDPAPSRKEIR